MQETREALAERLAASERCQARAEAAGFPNIAARMKERAETLRATLNSAPQIAAEGERL